MDRSRGVKRLLFGIELTLVGCLLVFISSGSAALLGLGFAAVGFLVAFAGITFDDRA